MTVNFKNKVIFDIPKTLETHKSSSILTEIIHVKPNNISFIYMELEVNQAYDGVDKFYQNLFNIIRVWKDLLMM